jgi:hypothetical protein
MPINPYQLAEQARKQIVTDKRIFRGGAKTDVEPEQLETGQYSSVVNVRNLHPGMRKRPGQQRLNSTTEGAAVALNTLYQFSKGKKSERHFYAQRSDGLIIEAATMPPGSIVGSLGSIVFTQTASAKPASWTIITDKMVFSNGVDQHHIYPGVGTPVEKFIVCDDTAAHPILPEKGYDYSLEVLDDSTSTVATLNGLGTLVDDYAAIYIMTPMPIKGLNFSMVNVNSTGASLSLNYWNGSWTSVTSLVDGTSAANSCTLGQNGSMAWGPPTDEITKYMYGNNGYWYQLYLVGGSLSGVCDVGGVTYDASFQPIQNVWDGIPVTPIEAQVFLHASVTVASDASASAYSISWPSMYQTNPANAIVLSSITPDDKIYVACLDPIEGMYVDMGTTPNSHSTTVGTVGFYNGTTWSTVSNLADATNGFNKSGWITFRRHTSVQPVQINKLLNYAYWYYITTSGNSTSSNLVMEVTTQPFLSISDNGNKGLANSSWKNRMCYVFDKTPNFVTISETFQPLHINGEDSTILQVGDGRSNNIVCMKRFFNELMVWQEEKGTDGGTLTLIEGYSPDTFGTLLLTNRVGTFSSKSACVVDGVLTSTRTDEQVKTIAIFLSHYGIFMSDGRGVQAISDDIQNYFDPTKTECIRAGYEDKMWIGYDSAFNVLRVGLVSGSSATNCNVFPVYDLVDRTWSFDSLGQALNSYIEIEAGSGNIPLIQCGGGTDGYLYRLNTSQNDVTTAINSYVKQELNNKGGEFMIKDIKLRHKVQTAGNITVTPYLNGAEKASFVIPMTGEKTGETIRRMKKTVDVLGHNIAFKFANASVSNDMTLFDVAYNLEAFDDR